MDENRPIENPELVAAMEALQQNPDSVTEEAFVAHLGAARFLMLSGAQGEAPPMITAKNGAPLHIAFTDREALCSYRDGGEEPETLVVRLADWPDMVLREGSDCAGVLINPGSHNMFVSRRMLSALGGQGDAKADPEPAADEVLIGEPDELPRDLTDAVKEALKPLRAARRAWLLLMEKERDGKRDFLVVVEQSGDGAAVSKAVESAARPHLPSGMEVEVVPLSDPFGERAAQGKKPFFKRGLFSW